MTVTDKLLKLSPWPRDAVFFDSSVKITTTTLGGGGSNQKGCFFLVIELPATTQPGSPYPGRVESLAADRIFVALRK